MTNSSEDSDSSTIDEAKVTPVVTKDMSRGAIPKTSRNAKKTGEVVNRLKNTKASQTKEFIQPTTSTSKTNKTKENVILKHSDITTTKTEDRSVLCTNKTKTPPATVEAVNTTGTKNAKLDLKSLKEAVTKTIDKLLRRYAFIDIPFPQINSLVAQAAKAPITTCATLTADEIAEVLNCKPQDKIEAEQLVLQASGVNTHVSQRIIDMYGTSPKWYKNVEKQLIRTIKDHDILETQIKKLDFIIKNLDAPDNLRSAALLVSEINMILQTNNSKVSDIRKRLHKRKLKALRNYVVENNYEAAQSNTNQNINKNGDGNKNKIRGVSINDNKKLKQKVVHITTNFPLLEKHLQTCKEQKDLKSSPKVETIAEEQLSTSETNANTEKCTTQVETDQSTIIEPDFCKIDRQQTTCGEGAAKKLKKNKIKVLRNAPAISTEITESEYIEEEPKESFKKWKDLTEFQNILHPNLVHIGKERNIFIKEAWIAWEIQYDKEMIVRETPGMIKFRRRNPFHVEDWEQNFCNRVNNNFPAKTSNNDKCMLLKWLDSEDYFLYARPYF